MAQSLNLRFGISDNPSAVLPTLSDCVEAVVGHAPSLVHGVLAGWTASMGTDRMHRGSPHFSRAALQGMEILIGQATSVAARFQADLQQAVYHGGKDDEPLQNLANFDALSLFDDGDLNQSIEIARAQQEVTLAVNDVLAQFDAYISTLLGWRTVQPKLNPLRPDVFVRALQAAVAAEIADPGVRDALITPLSGLMGVELRKLYRELIAWLRSSGVEPAEPSGSHPLGRAPGATRVVSKTLLTLDKLRRLLAGDFEDPGAAQDFSPTVPESLVVLQQLKQVDALVQRLADRPERTEHPATPLPDALPKLGHLLGAEVVRMMFDNLVQDARVLAPLKTRLRSVEHLLTRLAQEDARFFTDRRHAGRRFLDAMVQRGLAYPDADSDEWREFIAAVDNAIGAMANAVLDADALGEIIDALQARWQMDDQARLSRRAEAARALAHAEQRHMLALKFSADFAHAMAGVEVAGFVRDFLERVWPQVVAEVRLSDLSGDDDPFAYRTAVDDLIWSVQRTTAPKGRAKRLEKMIPALRDQLRSGLRHIDYPTALTEQFFSGLDALYQAAIEAGQDPHVQAAAAAAEAAPSAFADDMAEDAEPWLAAHEAAESGYVSGFSMFPVEAKDEADPSFIVDAANLASAGAAHEPEFDPPPLDNPSALRTGSWVELMVNGAWLRVQLTWATPHATLFMFTSAAGTAHSMSRRMLERLYLQGQLRTIAVRPVVDEALDQVAKAALHNSLSEPR
jgi:hypothetical protein